jgi:hypothetical protein
VKSVATLTFHNACNYGAFLQAYALSETLQSFPGVEAFILDYESPTLKDAYRARAILKQKGKLLNKVPSMVLRSKDIWKRNRMFRTQKKKWFRIKQYNVTREQLPECSQQYDAVIAGSDQIWNFDLTGHDTSFFLDFIDNPKKKYSYAASVGKSELTEAELKDMETYLKDFNKISVREAEISNMIGETMGDKDIQVHIDPVFLLKKEDWKKYSKKEKDGEYILLFIMGIAEREKHLIAAAEELSKATNLPIVYLSDQERWFKYRNFQHAGVIDPQSFVGLIDGAKYVVTNSFHGTAFSTIMHTTFFVDIGVARSSRIENLLSLTGLDGQGFYAENGILQRESVTEERWEQVDRILERERKCALDYLQEIVRE